MSIQQTDLAGKRLEILRELLPGLHTLAILANAGSPNAVLEMDEAQEAARRLGLAVIRSDVRRTGDFAPALDTLKGRAEALYLCSDPLLTTNRLAINTLAIGARLPTMHGFREFVEAGGLMSYGPNFPDLFRRAAEYVDKILRGAKPADLPVEQPTKFDLVINLTTAKALGLTIPEAFLAPRRRGDRMKRREFITLLGGAAAAWPLAARAQQPAMPLIGYVSSASADASYMTAFRQGLADLGYTEGRNVAIEFYWAEGKFERLPALLADLIQRRAAVIAVGGVTSGLAAKAATTTIPIVFLAADDPVKFGLVTSLSRPGGNATGLNLLTSELTTKRLELIRDLVPSASVVAVLVNPRSPESEPQSRDIERAAGAVGQRIRILNASSDRDIDAAFATLVKPRDAALLVTNDALFSSCRDQIVALAASRAIPTIYDRRAYADAGGLMSYGTHYLDGHRRLGIYTAKILNGAKPADLPVEQSTKFELVINSKTAKSLGLEVPASLLALADEVIE